MTAAARRFDFTARVAGGSGPLLRGTLDAADPDAAYRAVEELGLKPEKVTAADANAPGTPGGATFHAFNQQLAHLSAAGLPLEPGLRLLAREAHRGRFSRGVRAVAEELEEGVPLAEAIDRHRAAFPPLYADLVDAGIRTGRLPDVLHNLGRHLRHSRRISAAVAQAGAYPLVVLIALLMVTAFLAVAVLPAFADLFDDLTDYRGEPIALPWFTRVVLAVAGWVPAAVAAIGGGVVLLLLLASLARLTGRGPWLRDAVLRRLPLLGPPITQGLLARWCDLVGVGVRAGLDLPAALRLAGDATGSAPLRADGDTLVEAALAGEALDAELPLRMLPRPVAVAMAHGVENATLSETMDDLAVLYGGQAEMRLLTMHTVLGPVFFALLAVAIGALTLALFLPFTRMMNSLI